MNIIWNKRNDPLLFEFSNAIGNTTGVPAGLERKQVLTAEKDDTEKSVVGSYKMVLWGDDNDFPQKADGIIARTGVLNTGLKFVRNLTMGQGIYPCTVEGIDDSGNEVLRPVEQPGVRDFLNSRIVRRYMEKILRDYLKFGVGFVQLIPSVTGQSFAGINTLNALYARLTELKDNVQHCIFSGKFPDSPSNSFTAMRVLADYDPSWDLELLKAENRIKNQSFVFPVRDSWSSNDHYSCPVWWSAFLSGWIDIAHHVPRFLLKAYKNQVTLKWHIQIPYSFWEKKFPYSDYPEGSNERRDVISKYMLSVENNLCGEENAEKPIITMYGVNESGKIDEEWKITALDYKSKEGDKLVTSAAANSEILFALMINPNVMGAGMPGGAYAGNQGGSNIREAFLVNVANAWIDRQNILDPLECYLRFNGIQGVELRFRNTILTTLDTGAGTKKVLS
jgi:hypothetical protein